MKRQTMVLRTEADRQRYLQHVRGWTLQRPLLVSVEHYRKRRSNTANSYYWGVVLATIASETGQDADSLHAFFKAKFLGFVDLTLFGEQVTVERSTKKLSTVGFAEYIEWICAWAADFGIAIPEAA